jgi:hypothetical protein
MTEIQVLDRDIKALKDLLKVAWEDLATKSFTAYEFRERRNEMDRCAAELRNHLNLLEAQHNRARERSQNRPAPRPVSLRLLA